MSSSTNSWNRRRPYAVRSVTNNTARYNGLGRYGKRAAQSGRNVLYKTIKGISKDVTLRTLETKTNIYQMATQGIASGSSANTGAYNVFQPLMNDVFNSNVVGSSIYTTNLEFTYMFYRSGSTVDNTPITARVTLLKSARVWTMGSGTPFVTSPNIPAEIWLGSPGVGNPITRSFNPDAVTVLGQRYIRAEGITTGNGFAYTTGRISFPKIRGKKTYAQTYGQNINTQGGGLLKEGNYFLLIELFSGTNSTATNNITMTYDVILKYKDI